MASVPTTMYQPDGTAVQSNLDIQNVALLSSFEETIPMMQDMSFKWVWKNAVDDPLRAVQGFLYSDNDAPAISITNSISGRTVHASIKLTILQKVMERAYLAHIEDCGASDCPLAYSLPMMKLLRHVSYNWLGFMWQPGLGHSPLLVKRFVCSSKSVYSLDCISSSSSP